MPGLLSGVPLTDEERQKNDGPHNPWVVLAVLASLAVFLYLFTPASNYLSIPSPKDVTSRMGIELGDYFEPDGSIDCIIRQPYPDEYTSSQERLILFSIVGAAFLCAYFLPLRFKRPSLVFWTTVFVFVVYGGRALAGLLFGHLLVYLTLHPRRSPPLSLLAGVLGYIALGPTPSSVVTVLGVGGSAAAAAFLYRLVFLPLLSTKRGGPVLRTTVVQSAMITTVAGAILGEFRREEFELTLGILLFFWHWARIIMYHVDYKDGLVPKNVPVLEYFAIFLSPGAMGRWTWGVEIAQGYSYATNNYLAENKNKLALQGLKIWAFSLLYLVFYDFFYLMHHVFGALGIDVHYCHIRRMVCHYAEGGDLSTASVLITSILDRFRWLFLWGGIVHFKVGVWRICGYRVDSYFNKPWLATNLVIFWARYTFHYREFLVRAFYYPIFFRFFKRRPYVRILVATLASAAFGNLVWGHISEHMFYRGLVFSGIMYEISTWPYFLMLGLGITVAEIYIFGKRRKRRPWTFDRWFPVDVLCAYVSFQYFSLITIFRRPCEDMTNMDLLRVILIGLGIHI